MNEIQRVVDELRFLLQREVIENSAELIALLGEYSTQCHQVNVRLRRCDQCVKQGLRSEALHLAEAAPNLLDAVAVLDFPERAEMLELIGMYLLSPPEPLLLEVATALNIAYAEHAPLEKTLNRHRLLALERAPLVERLAVLRTLADLDSGSPHWDLDLREMERARFREFDSETASAAKSADAAALKRLFAEAKDSDWREPFPEKLLRDVKARTSQTIRGNARQQMQVLSEKLYAAFSALDAEAARPLRDEWNQAQRIVQLVPQDPLSDQVAPILEWLQDEDRKQTDSNAYTKLIAEIERSLDDEAVTSAELQRLQLATDRLERSLPPTLETRFRSRLRNVELVEGRRRKLKIAVGVCGFAIATGLVGMMIFLSVEGEKTRRLAAAATELIDEGKLQDAQKLIDQHGLNSASEAWLAAKKKLAEAQQTDQERILNWKAAIATIHGSTETHVAEAALKQARELSKTAEEKIEVGQLQATWQKQANAARAVREKGFREGVAAATEALQGLDVALSLAETTDSDRIRPLLETAESLMRQLMPPPNGIAKELASQGTLLESRLNASRKTVSDLARKRAILARLTEASLLLPGAPIGGPKPGDYETALRDYANTFPNDPRAGTLKSASENTPLKAVLTRQDLLDRWKRFRPSDKKDIETRLREIRSFLADHFQSPDRDGLTQYEAWLTSVLRRFEGEDDGDPDEGIQRRVYLLFNGKFIKEGHVFYGNNDDRVYYLEKTHTVTGDPVSFHYLTGFNGEKKRTEGMRINQLSALTTIAPPQQEVAAKVRSTIREVTIDGWRDYFRELAETLLKANKVDPFLRYLLVLKTLEFAGRGDSLLEQELAPLLEKLNDDDVDRAVAWMDPFNEPAKKARLRAQELLGKIPPLEALFAKLTKRQDQFERELFARRIPVGWIDKNASGDQWICRTKWEPQGEHPLLVASRPDATGQRTWLSLGRISGKTLTIDSNVAKSAGEAAVVFALSPVSEAKTAQIP